MKLNLHIFIIVSLPLCYLHRSQFYWRLVFFFHLLIASFFCVTGLIHFRDVSSYLHHLTALLYKSTVLCFFLCVNVSISGPRNNLLPLTTYQTALLLPLSFLNGKSKVQRVFLFKINFDEKVEDCAKKGRTLPHFKPQDSGAVEQFIGFL